jgi:hypothetical protein
VTTEDRPARQRLAVDLPVCSSTATIPAQVGLEIGRLARPVCWAALRRVAEEAGFTRFRRATETPTFMVLAARP